jgi:uncharacterized protein (TIGR00645 family)
MERAIESVLYWSRWLLVPIYFGLASLLLLLGFVFLRELVHLATVADTLSENDVVLAALTLIDLSLVASLVVMMVLSGYENFVSRFDVEPGAERLSWIGKLDASGLKLKVASSIVAISSIHLLKSFMNIETVPNDKLMWLVVIHMTFVASTVLMALVERLIPEKRF